jgi:arginase family enzyme
MAEVEARGITEVVTEARQIASPDGRPAYISVDIDGIDPAYAPATNSLEPGGFTSREIIAGVRLACQGGFAGFDVVEVSPDFDNPTGSTSVLAARLFVEAVCCLAADRAGIGPTWMFPPPGA